MTRVQLKLQALRAAIDALDNVHEHMQADLTETSRRIDAFSDYLSVEVHSELVGEYEAAARDHAESVFRSIMSNAHAEVGVPLDKAYHIEMPV